jgi:hypothetical protein
MQDHGKAIPPTLRQRALAWFTRSKIRPAPGPRLRLTIPRVFSLEELEGVDPPAWLRFQVKAAGKLEARRPSAMIVCPFGHRFAIAGGHSVSGTTGAVEPQVRCPIVGCEWIAFIELADWSPA